MSLQLTRGTNLRPFVAFEIPGIISNVLSEIDVEDLVITIWY